MKAKNITIILFSISFILFCLLWIINPQILKKVQILNCSENYYETFFESSRTNLNYHNAKMDIAKCLCQKYERNKIPEYKNEILEIFSEFKEDSNWRYEEATKTKEINIADICRFKNDIFEYWYYE